MSELEHAPLVNEIIPNIKIVNYGAWEVPLSARRRWSTYRAMATAFSRSIAPSVARSGALLIIFTVYTLKINVPPAYLRFSYSNGEDRVWIGVVTPRRESVDAGSEVP